MSKENIKPIRFYGQGKPNYLDKDLFENYFSDKRDGFYIECGASDGIGFSNSLLFELEMGWTGINIEASPRQFKALLKNRPDSINLFLGLSNKNGVEMFKDVISAPGGGEGNGSFSHTDGHMKELIGYRCVFKEYLVPVLTYANVIEIFGVSNVDLFSLDVEGHELQVIEGMKGCDILPDIFCIEHSVVGQENLIKALPEYQFEKENYVNSIFRKR